MGRAEYGESGSPFSGLKMLSLLASPHQKVSGRHRHLLARCLFCGGVRVGEEWVLLRTHEATPVARWPPATSPEPPNPPFIP